MENTSATFHIILPYTASLLAKCLFCSLYQKAREKELDTCKAPGTFV